MQQTWFADINRLARSVRRTGVQVYVSYLDDYITVTVQKTPPKVFKIPNTNNRTEDSRLLYQECVGYLQEMEAKG